MSELVPLLNVESVSASLVLYDEPLGARAEHQWELDGERVASG
jgi:hypothetical protein